MAVKVVHLAPLVLMGGEKACSYRLKTSWQATWQRIGVAFVASECFWFTLVLSLGGVGYRGLLIGEGVRVGALLRHLSEGASSRTGLVDSLAWKCLGS